MGALYALRVPISLGAIVLKEIWLISIHGRRGSVALVSPPLMSSRHRTLEPLGRWHATIYLKAQKMDNFFFVLRKSGVLDEA